MENREVVRFETVIRPKNGWFDLKLGEIFQYRDLIWMFVKRNFSTLYKQTVLGPAWIVITPMVTTVMYTIIFGNIANIGTDGIPAFLFYMAGNTAWNYFGNCFTGTSSTFTSNSTIFGKVYFPRLVTPISVVLTQLINFAIQFALFSCFLVYYAAGGAVHPNYAYMPLVVALLAIMAILGLGCGIIVSSLTTKYRDLAVLVGFGITLWMYATPIVYPVSQIPARWFKLFMLNPMAPVVETFRYAFLGSGHLYAGRLIYSACFALAVMCAGIVLFSRVEKTFMDTV